MHLLNLVGSGSAKYEIPNSVRFNSADSAYMNRTPGVAGNRKTWTFSAWVKRAKLGAYQYIFEATVDDAHRFFILFGDSDYLWVAGYNPSGTLVIEKKTSAVYRDPSAWMHLLVAVDTTLSSGRVKVYVNGLEITQFSVNTDTEQNAETYTCAAVQHIIGRYRGANYYLDGYLSDVYLIDGQQLTPASFGEFGPAGEWRPIDARGIARGTTGFFLGFTDGAAAANLGYDDGSGTNDWTVNNISVTAGAGNDWLADSPTNNYCTLNPLNLYAGYQGRITNGMLDIDDNSLSGGRTGVGTFRPTSGKWYWEARIDGVNGQYPIWSWSNYDEGGSVFMSFDSTGQKYTTGWVAYGAAFSNGDIAMLAIDFDAGKVWNGKNGTWYASGDPAAGTNAGLTFTPGTALSPNVSTDSTTPVSVNFGQRAFAYTPPTGFKALCTANLTSDTVTTSGSFTGNAAADGPFVWTNGNPATLTINGNAVTFGTHADKLANGFKLRTNSTSYNASGTNTWTATAGIAFRAPNNAQGNP